MVRRRIIMKPSRKSGIESRERRGWGLGLSMKSMWSKVFSVVRYEYCRGMKEIYQKKVQYDYMYIANTVRTMKREHGLHHHQHQSKTVGTWAPGRELLSISLCSAEKMVVKEGAMIMIYQPWMAGHSYGTVLNGFFQYSMWHEWKWQIWPTLGSV
jgi:hypothetical protein